MALKDVEVQLRVIWDHVRFLAESQMHPTPHNKMLLDRAEKKFSRAGRSRKIKTLSNRSAR